jgi:hypothetical protein
MGLRLTSSKRHPSQPILARLLCGQGRSRASEGFSLPLVILVVLALLASGLAVVARSSSAVIGSVRQQQSREAREFAESGAARTLESLNRNYRHLLIYPNSQWATAVATVLCPGSSANNVTNPITQTDTFAVGGTTVGRYTVEAYTFDGNEYYGGTGVLRVRGERLDPSGNVLATARVEQQVDIATKPCGSVVTTPPTSTGFPGLLANTISLGNNDVLGPIDGNVVCTSCTGTTQEEIRAEMNAGPNSIVNGNLFAGPVTLDPIPPRPSALNGLAGLSITDTTTLSALATDGASSNSGNCYRENGVTSCLINSINMSGGGRTLTIQTTTNNPVRLYVTGNVSFRGDASMRHTINGVVPTSPSAANSANLAIFGNPLDTNNANDQTVLISGGSQAIDAFIYFPDGRVGINGGSSNPDLRGAVWAKQWDGSNSNMAEILVPDGMGSTLEETIGGGFTVTYTREFIALGVNSWRSYQQFQ